MAVSEALTAQFEPQTIKSGNYEAQRQLRFPSRAWAWAEDNVAA